MGEVILRSWLYCKLSSHVVVVARSNTDTAVWNRLQRSGRKRSEREREKAMKVDQDSKLLLVVDVDHESLTFAPLQCTTGMT